MTTRRSRLLAVLLCAAPACVASDPPVRAEAPAEVPVDEAGTLTVLRASQKEPYGVPEVGDWGLTTGLTLAAVKWSLLSDEQLLGWARLWDAVRAEPDRPRVEYESEGADGSRVR